MMLWIALLANASPIDQIAAIGFHPREFRPP